MSISIKTLVCTVTLVAFGGALPPARRLGAEPAGQAAPRAAVAQTPAVHAGGAPKNAEAEYAYKLWLGHGVTTVRGVPMGANAFTAKERERSARNEIVAPRIVNFQRPGVGWDKGTVTSPEMAREYVQWA